MKKIVTIVVVICLCIAICLSAGCILTPNVEKSKVTPVPVPISTYVPTPTPVPMATFTTPSPTPTPVPMATFTAPTPTPTPTQKSQYYKLNELVTVKKGSKYFQTGVIDYMRGDRAYNTIHDGKLFVIVEPDDGNEFIFFEAYVKNLGTEPFDLINITYSVYADGVEQNRRYPTLPDGYNSLSSSKSILPGASTTGWYVFEVPIGSEVLISYHTWLYDDDVYFKI